MFEKLIATPFRFSIVGSSTNSIEIIKDAFREISIPILLADTYQSVKLFLTSVATAGAVDCIAVDLAAFNELESKQHTIEAPLIVFAAAGTEVVSTHNVVFETLHIPVAASKLEAVLKRLELLKLYFEKNIKENPSIQRKAENTSKTFLVRKGKEFQLINTNTIAVFFTDNKLTFAFDDNGTKFLIPLTLLELENQLDNNLFFRANRQSLINRKYINKIKQLDEGRFEIIIDAIETVRIDINQQKFSKLKEWIENN